MSMNKKMMITAAVLALLFAPRIAWAQTSAASYYVSAAGNDDNDGLTEATAFKTLQTAVQNAQAGTVKRITVIGTLNETSETMSIVFKFLNGTVFSFSGSDENTAEITITGKPGATGADRAVLSAKGARRA
jgi:hypothetical protein